MNRLNINKLLNREEEVAKIKEILSDFEANKHDLTIKKGIYIYGDPGSGKTTFITDILKELNYDIVQYDAGDIRNKLIIDNITKHNISDKNILSMFYRKVKKIVIVMDEIDGMNNGDKGGINTLIKLIRPKKTKKQKTEDMTLNPIICIGNYHIDKKIKDLMKVCNVIELKTPTKIQTNNIIKSLLPDVNESIVTRVVNFVQNDLRKMNTVYDIYTKDPTILESTVFNTIFQIKSYNDDAKKITQKLINTPFSLDNHNSVMNETDRTIVGLLWHENIIDVLEKMKKGVSIPFYIKFLQNICFSDYIDRITFQKQIWQFNEMSSLIKTFKNNKLYHDTFKKKPKFNPSEIRFTKVLTKYSTEYNNSTFIQNLCQQLGMDQKDIFSFFCDLKTTHTEHEIWCLFENYEISKLDISRLFRYIDNYTKECVLSDVESEMDIDDDNND